MADNKGYMVGDTIRINGVDYKIKSTQSGKQESSDYMDIRITGTSVKTLTEMCGEIGISIVDTTVKCIMCSEPVQIGELICHRCRTKSYATVAENQTDNQDDDILELRKENERLKQELRYTETMVECWKGFADEMIERFSQVISKRK